MRKILSCLAWANLTALIWLGPFGPALAATEPGLAGSFKPVQADLGSSESTAMAQADQRKAKRAKKAEKMPSTQSYPPPQAQPAPGPEEPQDASTADRKRGRNDEMTPVMTTVELPKKRESAQSGGRSGRKAKSAEAASVNPLARPGQVQAPAETSPQTESSTKKSRQRTERKSAVREAAPSPTGPAPARAADDKRRNSSRSKDRIRSRSLNQTPEPNQAVVVTAPASTLAPERAGSKSKKQRNSRSPAPTPDPNTAPAVAAPSPAPERAGSRSKKQLEPRSPAPAPLVAPALPTPSGPAVGLTPEQEMTRAYQAFDLAYSHSLGKTRKELSLLWGFPMQKMGDNGVEVAYGFRQKGLLDLPPEPGGKIPGEKKKAYFASSSIDPSLPGQYFTCLVVLWVDKQGRGVVVDGEAVGDCFMAETLSRQPDHFER